RKSSRVRSLSCGRRAARMRGRRRARRPARHPARHPGSRPAMNLKDHIRGIPNFPTPGILFYDISPLLAHPQAWQVTVDRLAEIVHRHEPDVLAGIERRGFLVSAPLALRLNKGFVMVRQKGNVPGATLPYTYELEYGSDAIEIQADAIKPGQKVFLLDDLLATGGTMSPAAQQLRSGGAEVPGAPCIIELSFLNGRDNLD